MMAIQLGHWAAFLAAMYRIQIGKVNGWSLARLGEHFPDAARSRRYVRIGPKDLEALHLWRFPCDCGAGHCWFEEAALFIFLIGIVLIALGLVAWWGADRSPHHG